jgi:ATP-dependent Clp protease adaptor protein ClpS|tara:strand:+ start:1276 stop:1617 length:342 start_codon:yes stop_codon:yes gene_type:complete
MIELSSDDKNNSSNGIGSAVLEKDPEIKEPPLYQVVLINDDYSPMEFVVFVLQTVFNHTHEKSTEIMMAVHSKGKGVCGIFSKEIAEMMSYEVNNMAKHHEHPLLSEIEPLTD